MRWPRFIFFRSHGYRHWVMAVVLSAGAMAGCSMLTYREARSHSISAYEHAGLPPAQMGAARFLLDDFRGLSSETLETTALPWKLATTALVLKRNPGVPPTQEGLRGILREFGFLYPQRIGNWPLGQPPALEGPMGVVTGTMRSQIPELELEVANLGCANCHAGRLYDAKGHPTNEVWLGLPNTSLDLDAYADAVVEALSAMGDDPGEVMKAIQQLHPDTTPRELATLQNHVWPRLQRRLPELRRNGGVLPFRNGGPGRSNGVEALKHRLGQASGPGDKASLSIPVLADLRLRSALLADGLYARRDRPRFIARTLAEGEAPESFADIVGFFTVSTMGVRPGRVPKTLPSIGEVMAFLDQGRTPPFPGAIDPERAARGAGIYAAECSGCHGDYVETRQGLGLQRFPNLPVSLEQIGTDPQRARAVTPALLHAIESSPLHRYIAAEPQDGYLAPSLSGLWATAPYLHNGSVPTLWHLLHPEARPIRFQAGGHLLDLDRVGIAGEPDGQGGWGYPIGYRPWSTASWFDTRQEGHSNLGHEYPFESLGEQDKNDLIEYLKRL